MPYSYFEWLQGFFIVHSTIGSTVHSMPLNSLEHCIGTPTMTNIRPDRDSNLVPPSYKPQSIRRSHRGRPAHRGNRATSLWIILMIWLTAGNPLFEVNCKYLCKTAARMSTSCIVLLMVLVLKPLNNEYTRSFCQGELSGLSGLSTRYHGYGYLPLSFTTSQVRLFAEMQMRFDDRLASLKLTQHCCTF